MTKITVDKKLLEQALMLADAIDRPNSRGAWHPTGKQLDGLRDELRAALAEPAVGPCDLCGDRNAKPADKADMAIYEAIADGCQMEKPAFPQPSEVPLLTGAEIMGAGIFVGWVVQYMDKSDTEFARVIEQMVRRKAGLA